MEIITRSLMAAAIILCGVGAYWTWNRWHLRRLSREPAGVPGLEGRLAGVPAILYFTMPDCLPCRTAQRPTLERLKEEYAEGLQVLEVDASARPAIADYWGVLSVPTTFVIDAAGRPRRVNHGVTGAEKLKHQLAEVTRATEARASQAVPSVPLAP